MIDRQSIIGNHLCCDNTVYFGDIEIDCFQILNVLSFQSINCSQLLAIIFHPLLIAIQ